MSGLADHIYELLDPSPFQVGRLLWEARIRTACGDGKGGPHWNAFMERELARNPWPAHIGAERAAEHDLAFGQALALLKAYELKLRP